MHRPHVSITALPAWCKLNNVTFFDASVEDLGSTGHGIVASRDVSSLEKTFDIPAFLNIPNELILCRDMIDEHAKVDRHFRELLEVAGGKSLRHDVLLFLLMQITIASPQNTQNFGVSNPWTEYVKMLPDLVPLPTTWTEEERMMLNGTSLELALNAKMASLEQEFEAVYEATSNISWCQKCWWDESTFLATDWSAIDAWFRSRSLEHPILGEAMIPSLDMVNHSSTPNAFYEPGTNDSVKLLLRPGASLKSGSEITISYGEAKSRAEMLFSYGFIEGESATRNCSLTLPVVTNDASDPLTRAKNAIFSQAKLPAVVQINVTDEGVQWNSPFLYLLAANEEDGLDFRVLQENDGTRGLLRVFWQEEDVTNSLASFEDLIAGNSPRNDMGEIFRLRAVAILEGLLRAQLQALEMADVTLTILADSVDLDVNKQRVAILLREDENDLLVAAIKSVEKQKTDLLQHEGVQAFLESQQEASEPQDEKPGNNDDDFS